MKIAFINIYQGEVERGLETYIYEISQRLKKKHSVEVFSGHSSYIGRWPYLWRFYIDPQGVKIALFTLKILPKIWKDRYDFVFALNGGWQPALIRMLTWLYGGKMIISGQSGKGWDDRNNLWCFPDSFVALSRTGFDWAKRVNPYVRIDKIPNGVDLNKFKPEGVKYDIKLKPPVVICQGALEPSKRVDLAIRAVSTISGTSLLVVGKGSLQNNIHQLGKKLMGNRFGVINVPHSLMPSVYRVGKVFTLPSESTEAFGISYVEAMACGLPVVATNDELRKEIIGDAGLLTDPTAINTYASAIKSALKNKWGSKPRKQAEKYDWDKITGQYESLFLSLQNDV